MYTVRVHQHYTWDEFLDTVAKRPAAGGWNDSSIDTDNWRRKFCQSDSLEHALSLARTGWPEGRARMLSGLEHESAGEVPGLLPSIEYDLAGEVPDVAAYCAGVPEHMVSYGEQTVRQSPVVRLGYNGNVSCKVEPEDIVRYGLAVLSHVSAYQRAGYSVAVDWLSLAAHGDEVSVCVIELLPAGGVLDLDRLAYMLAHPSMLRRLWFAWVESYRKPGHKSYTNRFLGLGYGHPATVDKIEGWTYPGIALPSLRETPTRTVQAASDYLGEYIETRRAA